MAARTGKACLALLDALQLTSMMNFHTSVVSQDLSPRDNLETPEDR